MKNELTLNGLSLDEFCDYILNYNELKSKINSYSGTNLKQANILLNSVLNDTEKATLFNLMLGDQGWYRKINGEGAIKLKLAAFSLGLTHGYFSRIPDDLLEDKIDKIVMNTSENELDLIASCYLKQKIITKVTLINYKNNVHTLNKINFDNNKISLYRGIKRVEDIEKYLPNSLESWTSQLNIAQKFSNQGIILKLTVDIDNLLFCRKSAFKHNNLQSLYLNKKINQGQIIRREHEYLVEFSTTSYDLSHLKDNIYILN